MNPDLKVAIMQPYFFPYIGYFQLINAVDQFIIYDNIKYTKKGWFNRNRMLLNGKEAMFSIPLKRDSDYLHVRERELAADFRRRKLLNQINGAYHRAPYFSQTFPLVEKIILNESNNLFAFLYSSIINICKHLEISTDINISSNIVINHDLKNQEKVIAICKAVGAATYVNSFGGIDLYSKAKFDAIGIDLQFIQSLPFQYRQLDEKFVPWLSIIDVLMFNSLKLVQRQLSVGYKYVCT